MDERFKRIEELYHAALEREPDMRESFVEEACAGDDDLRRELTSLLTHHDREPSFLDGVAFDVVAKQIIEVSVLADTLPQDDAGRVQRSHTA